jgi:hypothetical protein
MNFKESPSEGRLMICGEFRNFVKGEGKFVGLEMREVGCLVKEIG